MSQKDFNETQAPKKNNAALVAVLGGCGCVATFLVVIGLLLVLFLPSLKDSKVKARQRQCANQMKQICLALHNYHDVYNSFPPAYTTDENGNPLHSWRVLLLPFWEQKELYDKIRLDEPWDSEYNSQFHTQMPRIYWCVSSPFGPSDGFASYHWVIGPNTISNGTNATKLNDVSVKLSDVICLVEVNPTTCWMAPVDIPQSDLSPELSFSRDGHIGSQHVGGINVGYMDGSVQFMSNDEAGRLSEKVKIKR